MALIDEMRMDRTVLSVVTSATPSDAKEYWKSKTMMTGPFNVAGRDDRLVRSAPGSVISRWWMVTSVRGIRGRRRIPQSYHI